MKKVTRISAVLAALMMFGCSTQTENPSQTENQTKTTVGTSAKTETSAITTTTDTVTENPADSVAPVVGGTIKFGEYDWRVLDVQNGQALIISKDVTHVNMPYNEDDTDVTWATCTLRKWLNEDFLSTFSDEEQSRILLTTNTNEDNQWYGTSGGNETEDKIFLLSLSEVVKYFGDSGQLENENPESSFYIDDRYNKERIADYNGSAVWWWLRSPGSYGYSAACVIYGGDVNVFGYGVNDSFDYGGVRPALWVSL